MSQKRISRSSFAVMRLPLLLLHLWLSSRTWAWMTPLQSSTTTKRSSSLDGRANSAVDVSEDDGDSLTLQELATRLQMVRQQVRAQFDDDQQSSSEAIAAQLEICDQMLCTRFRNLKLSRAEVKPSPIHGIGLFATRPIAKDEIITCYPGDALLAWGDDTRGKPGPIGCSLQAMYGPHILPEEQSSSSFFLVRPDSRDFEVVTGKCRSIVGDPARTKDSAYLGHIANDSTRLSGTKDKKHDIDSYNKKSMESANAAHLCLEGCHSVTVASRTIDEGEEVLLSYGEGYWKEREVKENDDKRISNCGFRKKNKK